MITTPSGEQFEISVDGKPRSHRDTKVAATAAAEFLKNRNPHSEIAVKDLQSGEVTVVIYRPERGWVAGFVSGVGSGSTATFPNGAPEQIQGFATEADAVRWIKNESALWLHQRRFLAKLKCRRFLGIPKRRLVRPTINEISPDDTEITMPRLRTNLRIRMAQPYFFLL